MPGPTRAYYDDPAAAASPGRQSPGGRVVPSETPSDLEAGDAAVAEAQQGAIGAAAPPLDQPVGADRVSELGEALTAAYDSLTGEADKAMVPTIAPLEQSQVAQLPPDVFAPLAAFGEAMQSAADGGVTEAKSYAFDAVEKGATLEGVAEVTALLKKAAQDTKLQEVLLGGPEEPTEKPEKPAEEPTEKPEKGKMSREDMDAMLK